MSVRGSVSQLLCHPWAYSFPSQDLMISAVSATQGFPDIGENLFLFPNTNGGTLDGAPKALRLL